MKKSKFLQNPKDLLHRSFNPAKCKTSLRLAGSKSKLLKNKKGVQVKQMKREIAQLLESGQDQTARIRVEHVIREEKMIAAYDLLEIYCELIVARLPIIESQKNCPIDLKEAIASLVFAAPRCGDIPELLDARKHFSAKYGKDFITAATELRPQCGVGRLLVEKLSAAAPDEQTKNKLLTAIAEEHNVKWDPSSFEEKQSLPPGDLQSERKDESETPQYETANLQGHPSNKIHSSPINSSQQDYSTSVVAEKPTYAQTSVISTTFQPEARPPALPDEREQQGDSNTSPLDRQRWPMEFKDATSAAQAAAASAERASMAARAAAELASHGRISGQHSTELEKSNVHILEDERPEAHQSFPNEKVSESSHDRSSSDHIRLQDEHLDGNKPNYLKISTKVKGDGDVDSLDHGMPVVDEFSQNSLKELSEDEMSMTKESFNYEAETANHWPETSENTREGRTGKEPSESSSRSQSSISDDVNVFANFDYTKFESDTGENPFAGTSEGGIYAEETHKPSFHESAAVGFDDSDSDIDDHVFDKGPTYDEQDLELHLPSLGQTSPEQVTIEADSLSPAFSSTEIEKSTSSLFFTEEKSSTMPDILETSTLRDDSELDNFARVTFDDSEGPTESDEDIISNRHNKAEASRDVPRKHNETEQLGSQFEDENGELVGSPSKVDIYSVLDSKELPLSSDDELSPSEEVYWKRNQVNIFRGDSPEKLSIVEPSVDQPAFEPGESSSESGEGLNFAKLTGGLRHKRQNHLPFLKNRLDESSSVKDAETTDMIIRSSSPPPPIKRPEISTTQKHRKTTIVPDLHSETDSDSSEEEESLQKSSGHKQSFSPIQQVKTKPGFLGASNAIFNSDSGDTDEDSPKESVTRTSHLRSGISRRTKASPSSSGTNSYTKGRLRSETLDSDAGMDGKSTNSNNSENPKKLESQMRNSSKWKSYEQPNSSEAASMPAKSNFWGPPARPGSGKSSSLMESETRFTSEARYSDARLGRKPSNSNSPDTPQGLHSLHSSQVGKFEQPKPAKVASEVTTSSPSGTSEKSNSGKTIQEPEISEESSLLEESSSSQQKSEASTLTENTKTAASDKTTPDKDESVNKASHVHPKLPDYDTLFQSLRMNRS